MNITHEIELLAPAGSYEAFEAALGAGADAVYVGGPDFGARAYARNFTQEELIRAIHTAHIHGKKLYLTVNTLLKNRELKERLYDSLCPLYEEGLDENVISKTIHYISQADVLIIGGTSLVVYPAAGLIDYFKGSHLILINKSATQRDSQADLVINDKIGEVFGQL